MRGDSRRRALDALVKWLGRNGASFPKLRVVPGPDDEWMVEASADIAPGERVVVIPPSCLITVQRARESAVGRRLSSSGLSHNDSEYLVAFALAQNEKRRSFFGPYLASLPRSFRNLAVNFTRAEVAALRGSSARPRLDWRRRVLAKQRERLLRADPTLSRFSSTEVCRLQLSVGSRAFRIPGCGAVSPALVPLADMLQHAVEPDVHWAVDRETGSFVMEALRPIRRGDPVRDSYGNKCNCQLLIGYGFALSDNANNRALLRFMLPEDAMRAQRAKLLGVGEGRRSWAFHVRGSYAAASTVGMFWFLRVACADAAELRRLSEDPGTRLAHRLVGRANEMAALAMLGAACTDALAQLAGSDREDSALLASPSTPRNLRHVALVRQGERRVLRQLLAMSDTAMPLLRMSSRAATTAMSGWARQDTEWGHYLSRVVTALL